MLKCCTYLNNGEKMLSQTELKKMTDKVKPTCPVSGCGKYTDKKTMPQCFGHGAPSSDSDKESGAAPGAPDAPESATKQLKMKPAPEQVPFNYKAISAMLDDKFLLLERKEQIGTLSFKLFLEPKDLTPEQRKAFNLLMDAIINELEQFKIENGLEGNFHSAVKDKDNNYRSLNIHLPEKLYLQFIQRLMLKNLLPMQNSHLFHPTPLSTKPVPARLKHEEENKLAAPRKRN